MVTIISYVGQPLDYPQYIPDKVGVKIIEGIKIVTLPSPIIFKVEVIHEHYVFSITNISGEEIKVEYLYNDEIGYIETPSIIPPNFTWITTSETSEVKDARAENLTVLKLERFHNPYGIITEPIAVDIIDATLVLVRWHANGTSRLKIYENGVLRRSVICKSNWCYVRLKKDVNYKFEVKGASHL